MTTEPLRVVELELGDVAKLAELAEAAGLSSRRLAANIAAQYAAGEPNPPAEPERRRVRLPGLSDETWSAVAARADAERVDIRTALSRAIRERHAALRTRDHTRRLLSPSE